MIAILLSCLLFIFGLLFTLPPKKIHSLLQSHKPTTTNHHRHHDVINVKEKEKKIKVDLRDVFATFDQNNDGFITRQELKESLKKMGMAAGEGDVADMVARVDANGDGLIDLEEFCHLLQDDADAELQEAFEVFDGNKDGLITVEELGLVLTSLGFSEGGKSEDCKEMIRKVDVDGDGMVNFDEFKNMMRDGILNS